MSLRELARRAGTSHSAVSAYETGRRSPTADTVDRIVRAAGFALDVVPFLACRDIAVFKVFFDRTQDWADLEQMAAAGTLDTDTVAAVIAAHLSPNDPRIDRLRSLENPR